MPKSVQSVERAAAMLQLLASEDEPLGLMQVATALDLPKGTVHGLLRTLREVGFVSQDSTSGRYQVSPDLYRLGTPRLDLHELRARALNWTDALAAHAEEAVAVAAFRDGAAVVAHYVLGGERTRPTHGEHDGLAGHRERRITVGIQLPLHADALGKVLLAFDPGATRSLAGKPLISLTHRTITDRVALQRELALVRDRGWAADVEEQEPGQVGIAAPIRDYGGYVVAAVGINGSIRRLCDDRLRPSVDLIAHVQQTARSISRELGHGTER
ncbi:IclR family transcriptional regulator [Mycobacterium sp. SWH-M3]|nr:IclR family transcriptional regulator [Mycobacterium sp. SWH-M3]